MSDDHRFLWFGVALSLLGSLTVPGFVRGDVTPCAKPVCRAVSTKLHSALLRRMEETSEPVKAWVFFADKGIGSQREYAAAIEQVSSTYNKRSVVRRALRGKNALRGEALFDEHDLPVAKAYTNAVAATGAQVRVSSKWLNAVSVYATREQLEEIAQLSCVSKLHPVARAARRSPPAPESPVDETLVSRGAGASRGRLDYGNSYPQLTQMNLIALHDAGYTGAGVIVGIIDSGFKLTHEAYNVKPPNIIAAYDFINDDSNVGVEPGDPPGQHDHGTETLSCLAAYKPGKLVGGAHDASFILAKTEEGEEEYPAEEDNFVAGMEFVEANGADMCTASIGYSDWYSQGDMDGLTSITTIAVNILTGKGVHFCSPAGNEYNDSDPNTSSLLAPADGFQTISCGAVDSAGDAVNFSSEGPTADGRVKPELLARGALVSLVSPNGDTGYLASNGTSFSTPLIAGAVACIIQARPYWTVDEMRQHLFETATDYVANGTYDPLYVRGYGIIDASAACDLCSDAGEITLDRPEYACEGTANVRLQDCGLNTDDGTVEHVKLAIGSDSEMGVEQVTLSETAPNSAEFTGSIELSTTNSVDVLWVAEGDTITVTYLDADDGEGHYNVPVIATAQVDCTPPSISNVQATDVRARRVTIAFDADEPVCGTIHYGESCALLTDTKTGTGHYVSPTVELFKLNDDTLYYFAVEAEDRAGNPFTDDNGGACYTFTTPDVPDFFTELFVNNGPSNMTLIFTPDGSADFYSGCVESGITELPTDPAGGATLSLGDDDNEQINLTGGATVLLYGQSYGTIYPGSNGYLTFLEGDIDRFESLLDHFDVPRISVLFDDLNPSAGGTVSWKQLVDRVAVTWLDVPEWDSPDGNTFQIEMFFDGTITISYLDISAPDGLAGLSEGNGMDPEFLESDLSELGSCGGASLVDSTPLHEQSLWRTANNFVRLTFDADIMTPANGELLIEVMNSNGAFGTSYTIATDTSADFKVGVANDGYGNPRILEIWENGSVLTHTDWIAVRNVGGWSGVAEFYRHYPVLKGDVNGDGDVLPTDFGPMFPYIPTFGADPDERADVDGNRDVLPTDFGPMFPYIPTFGIDYPKPPGHLP